MMYYREKCPECGSEEIKYTYIRKVKSIYHFDNDKVIKQEKDEITNLQNIHTRNRACKKCKAVFSLVQMYNKQDEGRSKMREE